MTGTRLLDADEAADLLAPAGEAWRIILAVSGGPDSVALMHLAAEVAATRHWPPLTVATVDHGLQGGSAAIAEAVTAEAERLGLDARLLRWDGAKPTTGLQDAARRARYALLDGLAAELGATHLVTAHTLDDQAETILFRLMRGSGPAGLIGMRGLVRRGAVVHVRPFLGVEKQRLVATCLARGWAFVQDPANSDPRFARSRMRSLLPALAAEGLDARAFATLAARLARTEEAIGSAAESLRRSAARPAPAEQLAYDAATLFDVPRAVLLRLLEQALSEIGSPGAPRLSRLEALVDRLDQSFRRGTPLRATLHGTLVSLGGTSRLELRREKLRRRGRLAAQDGEIDPAR